MKTKTIVSILSVWWLVACQHAPQKPLTETPKDSLKTEYATLFAVRYYDEYKQIAVTNRWSNDTLYYYLTKNPDVHVPENGTKLTMPLDNIAITSCTHISYFDLLHETDRIKAMASPELAYNSKIRKRIATGRTADIGDAFSLNTEKVILQRPQIVMMNDFNGENLSAKKLKELGIPVVFVNEWQENSPLARAEWIKMIGALLDKEDLADSIFNAVKERYDSIKNANTPQKTTILSGNYFHEIWNVPGGKSYMGAFFCDAGFDYLYKNNPSTESIKLSMEAIFEQFHNADVWIGCPANTLDELTALDTRYTLLKSVKNGAVFNYKKRNTPTGGNDFWETGVVRPDIVLEDLSRIARQQYDSLYFMNKLE